MATAELIRRGARHHADKTAVLCGDERLTFAETVALDGGPPWGGPPVERGARRG